MKIFVNRFKKMKNKKGFTLVELIVVIVIIGILAAILIPRLTGFTDKAKETEAVVWAKEVATAYDALVAETDDGDYADVDEAEVLSLAGVISGSGITVELEDDGGLEVTAPGGTAGREDDESEVRAGYTN